MTTLSHDLYNTLYRKRSAWRSPLRCNKMCVYTSGASCAPQPSEHEYHSLGRWTVNDWSFRAYTLRIHCIYIVVYGRSCFDNTQLKTTTRTFKTRKFGFKIVQIKLFSGKTNKELKGTVLGIHAIGCVTFHWRNYGIAKSSQNANRIQYMALFKIYVYSGNTTKVLKRTIADIHAIDCVTFYYRNWELWDW